MVKPAVEDIRTRTKKKVVLVFDDMERSRIDRSELLGCINEYCENKHFNTILIADSEAFTELGPKNGNLPGCYNYLATVPSILLMANITSGIGKSG